MWLRASYRDRKPDKPDSQLGEQADPPQRCCLMLLKHDNEAPSLHSDRACHTRSIALGADKTSQVVTQ
ncbi:uncharacterized [Tachysurus ichikawai]